MLVLLRELPSRNRKVWEPSLGFCEKEVGKGGKYLPRWSFMSAPARRSYLRIDLLLTNAEISSECSHSNSKTV